MTQHDIFLSLLLFSSCLDGMKDIMTRCNKTQKKKNKRKKSKRPAPDNEPTTECIEPQTKRQRLEDKIVNDNNSKETTEKLLPSVISDRPDVCNQSSKDVSKFQLVQEKPDPILTAEVALSKKSQIIVGVNSVSRCLERHGSEGVRGGMVCLSAQPALILRHLMMLAATRGVPFVALPNLSQTAAPLLGLKTVLAIGFKVYNYVTYNLTSTVLVTTGTTC